MTISVYKSIVYIEELINKPPPKDFLEIIALTQNTFVDAFLFDTLSRPDWLIPLIKNEFFSQDSINSHPYRLSYLQRLLPDAVDQVSEILKYQKITAPQARQGFLNLLTSMPADFLRAHVAMIEEWALEGSLSNYGYSIEALFDKTLNDQEFEGLDWFILRILLMPARTNNDDYLKYESNIDSWRVQHLLEKHREVLQTRSWFIPLLIEILAQFTSLQEITASRFNTNRHHLLHRQYDNDDSPSEMFINLILDYISQSVKTNKPLDDIWMQLRRYPYDLFTRIRLILLAQISQPALSWIRSSLLDQYAFNNLAEYRDAAHAHFSRLPESDQQTVWKWAQMEESPLILAYYQEHEPQNITRFKERSLWRKLQRLQPHIPENLKVQWITLAEQYGQQERHSPEFFTKEGSSSTLTPQAIAALNVHDVLEILKGDPPRTGDEHFDHLHDRVSGLRDVLRHDVQQRYESYFSDIQALKTIPAVYLSTIIYAVRALQNTPQLPVLNLVDLFHFANQQSQNSPVDDQNWSWCVGNLADLFGDHLLKDDVIRGRFGHADEILSALEEALLDPHPLAENSRDRRTDTDVYTTSLNVTRGKAMHALIRFIGWMHDLSIKQQEPRAEISLAKAKRILINHIASGEEHSNAVYAAVVPTLPWITYTDPAIGMHLIEILLARSNPQVSRHAWTTHLKWNRYFSQFFTEIRSLYAAYACIDLPAPAEAVWDTGKETQHLYAQHIAMFYIRGDINPGERDRILENFLEYGNTKSIAETVDFLSRSLKNTEGEVKLYAERLKSWWELLYQHHRFQKSYAGDKNIEDQFAAIFGNPRIDLNWKLNHLNNIATQSSFSSQSAARIINDLNKMNDIETLQATALISKIIEKTEVDLRIAHLMSEFLEKITNQRDENIDQIVNIIVERMMEVGYIPGFRRYHR
ncbi:MULTISPECIES: hypothetical protein [unclassified Deinococcus]|uniref:hypothetical protein n=1 Tax=unclassified Deinococcus TaxID=2623546 RepID=UPI00117E72FA|nr:MULTISPECIES: hypothetical protein [unclassified Deinococcus]MBX8467007.1 hypothetical protein [Deinococcus sp. RIT780]